MTRVTSAYSASRLRMHNKAYASVEFARVPNAERVSRRYDNEFSVPQSNEMRDTPIFESIIGKTEVHEQRGENFQLSNAVVSIVEQTEDAWRYE